MLRQPLKNLHSARIGSRCPWILLLVGAILLTVPLPALAGTAGSEQPVDALKRMVEDGIHVLKDPHYSTADRTSLQHQKLQEILYRDFDFTEFSRRVLANKWALFSGPQRIEFIGVFSRFLAEYYLARLQQYYTGEKVVILGQDITGPGRAVVKTQVVWKSREFSVDVRMHSRGGQWKTYDVSMIGVSAVQIYRAQFQEILSTQSPAQVIDLIRRRIEE